MYKLWSKKEIFLLREYYPKLRVKDLVEMFPKRNRATIAAKAQSLNLPSAKIWQSEENNILYKNFAEASEQKLIKLLPKRSWQAILAQGERLGLNRKTNKPKLNINEDYFKKWSSNMVYILGFIFADGNITKITNNGYSDKLGFGQNKKDIDILRKIKQELSAEQALSPSGNYVHFSIFSQVIVDDLKKLGVSYRKSFRKSPTKIPNIPQKYIRDFIRGIVDGDGSISFNKKDRPTLSICGREEVMTFIRNHFLSKFKIYSKVTGVKKNEKSQFIFYIAYRTNSAKTLIKYLYNDAELYLERKFKLAKRAIKMKIRHRKNYTDEEKRNLQQFYALVSKDKILSLLPHRNWPGIQQKTHKLRIYKYNIK